MKILWMVRLINTVCFLALLPIPCLALTPAQVFDKVKDTVVVVKTLDARGEVNALGSGVLLSSGRVATNCHVVEGGTSYRVGRGNQLVPATLYAEDADKDICILAAKGITGTPVQFGEAAGLKVGDPVYAVGAPKGLELSLSDGIVAQLRGGPPPLIQTTAAISPGSSGGGLFDKEGRLVGLTTLYIEGGQSLNFAMPVEWIDEIKPVRKPVAGGIGRIEWAKRAIALGHIKDWHRMLDWCQKWTKNEPRDGGAWFALGLAYGHLSRYDDEISAYREALRIYPKDAKAWFLLGGAYISLKRYEDAISAYREGLQIDPEDAGAWFLLGAAYGHLKRYEDAISAYREALRIDSKDAKAWSALGRAYSGLEYYEDAISAYREALRIYPKDAKAWYGLGLAYILSGNQTAALAAVRKLRRLDPERADKLFNLIVPR
jgi:cytochrome c-type biogenesis protein CcmH/NrfG